MRILWVLKEIILYITVCNNKKHLKNVGPIRHNEPPNANSPDVASGTVARRLRIDVHDNDDNDNDNAWQRWPLWPHGMGPIIAINFHSYIAAAVLATRPLMHRATASC